MGEKDYIDIDRNLVSLAKRSNEVPAEEALEYLAELYIDNCGISFSTRSVAWMVSQFWILKWRHESSCLKSDVNLFDYMRQDSSYYQEHKELAEKYFYDFCLLDLEDLHRIALEMIEDTKKEKEKITIASGVMFWIITQTQTL